MWQRSTNDHAQVCRPLTIEEHIVAHRETIAQEDRDAHVQLQRAVSLRAHAKTLTAPHQYRMAADIIREADEIEESVQRINNGTLRQEYERFVEPYVSQLNTCIDSLEQGGTSRILTAPGASDTLTLEGVIQSSGCREHRRSLLTDEFIQETKGSVVANVARSRDNCPLCDDTMRMNLIKSILVCTHCGYSYAYLDSTCASTSYSDDYELSTFCYKRITHFDDCMKQSQGKEATRVSDSVINQVMAELYAQRIRCVESITQSKVREVLKHLRLRKAYDNVAQITSRITGVPAPSISPMMEDRCRTMFAAIQPSFDKHCPSTRKNFLSYNYVLFRFYHLLGLTHMLSGFALLKGKDKLAMADAIFKSICREHNWPFTPIDELYSGMR